jgi:hypothetical protein
MRDSYLIRVNLNSTNRSLLLEHSINASTIPRLPAYYSCPSLFLLLNLFETSTLLPTLPVELRSRFTRQRLSDVAPCPYLASLPYLAVSSIPVFDFLP